MPGLVQNRIRASENRNSDSYIQFPEDLGAHSMLLVFKNYQYQKPGTRRLNKISESSFSAQVLAGTDSLLLPLPANIQDNYNVRVNPFEQGISGEIVASAAGGVSGLGKADDITFGQLSGILGSVLPEISLDALKNFTVADFSRSAAFLGRRTIDGLLPGASRNIDVGFGNTINPKMSLFFEGVDLKTHTFSWQFSPTTPNESDLIRDVGNTIKKNVLPTYGTAVGISRALLNYPSMLDIFFFGADQRYFLFYKTCMVQSFNIDFSPNGLSFVKGGKPSSVTMSMNVVESDIHTSEDYGGQSTTISASPQDIGIGAAASGNLGDGTRGG